MGDDEQQQPFLAHAEEDAVWSRTEEAHPGQPPVRTVRELVQAPDHFIKWVQEHGVVKLGEWRVEDRLVLGQLGDDSIVTLGCEKGRDLDFEAAWHRRLGAKGPCGPKQCGWSSEIPVIAYMVNIRDASKPDADGLLQPLLKRWQAGGCSFAVFGLPASQAVIDWKWESFCRRLLLWQLALYSLGWVLPFFAWTIAFQDEDTSLALAQLARTPRGKLAIGCDALCLLGMSPFLLMEFTTAAAYGFRGWLRAAWNLLDVATYAIQITVSGMHLSRRGLDSPWLSVLAASQCILLLFRLQWFSRVFKPTRFAFASSLAEVVRDVKWYLVFLVAMMVGWAIAFHILFRADQEHHEEFSTPAKAFVLMVTWVAGNADLNPVYENTAVPVAASVLAILYVFVLGMVLMNLLIGVMTNSLERVTKHEGLRMLLSKAQIIDEIEATLPRWVERRFPRLYPRYLHVLRLDPDKLDAVRLDAMWAREPGGGGGGEPLLQGAGGDDEEPRPETAPGHAEWEQLRLQVDAMRQDLREVKELLRADSRKSAAIEL